MFLHGERLILGNTRISDMVSNHENVIANYEIKVLWVQVLLTGVEQNTPKLISIYSASAY